MPVDLYVGGPEHAVGHLLYSRMWCKFLYDKGVVNCNEPFKKLVHQGMILGQNGIKMGKRYPEYAVNPDDIVNDYGADTLRLYEMFLGPLEADKPWNNDGVVGARKFLDRIFRLYKETLKIKDMENKNLDKEYNKLVKKVTEDFETLNFNTAISQMMIYINAVYKEDVFPKYQAENFLKLLNPVDDSKLKEDSKVLAVQVNGKLRSTITIPLDLDDEKIKEEAINNINVKKYLEGNEIIKIIVVKNKIVNIVVK